MAALLIAGLVFALAASANGAPEVPDDSAHLFVVSTDNSAQETALADSDARVVARYEAFTLVEASGGDATGLAEAGADQRDDMRLVTTARGTFDPTEREPLVARRSAHPGEALALVQFVGPVKDSWLSRVKDTGVRLVSYVAQNGYLVHGSARQLRELAEAHPAVRALVAFTARDKIADGVQASGRQLLAMQTISGKDGAEPRQALATSATARAPRSAVGPYRTQVVRAEAAEVSDLARDPGVVSVNPKFRFEPADERQGQILAGALSGGPAPEPLVPSAPGYLEFLDEAVGTDTFDFVVDVTDSGFDTGSAEDVQPDFRVDGDEANPSRIEYIHNRTSDAPDGRDCWGHGTAVASVLGGFNARAGSEFEDAEGFQHGLGIAPQVRIGVSKGQPCEWPFFIFVGTLTELTKSAYRAGARISNNSWGSIEWNYSPDTQEYDKLVRDADPDAPGNQEMVEVFAAGNEGPDFGTITDPGYAKNVITVGASESVRQAECGRNSDDARDIGVFSGRGPTSDGRLKPDVVAPGTRITAALPQGMGASCVPPGATGYVLQSGTSFAAPAVTGAAALIREWYRQNVGGGTDVPSPALTKAILTNSATDIDGGDGTTSHAPNYHQGWGLVNIDHALGGVRSDAPPRILFDQEHVFGESGETYTRTFRVADPSQAVKVSLAWTDMYGPTFTAKAWVNDLDLVVETEGDSFKGNVFADGASVPGGDSDERNNLEGVFLPAGSAETFSVTVRATNVAGDGVPGNADETDQDFALVVANATDATPPETAIDAGPAKGSLIGGGTATFEFSSSEEGTFECELDHEGFESCVSPFTTPPLTSGAHTFAVRATDAAGNTDPTPATFGFEVRDAVAPKTKIAKAKIKKRRGKALFRFRSNEAQSKFRCKLDRASYRRCKSPKRYRKLKSGRHVFRVKAIDGAGNSDRTPAKKAFRIR